MTTQYIFRRFQNDKTTPEAQKKSGFEDRNLNFDRRERSGYNYSPAFFK